MAREQKQCGNEEVGAYRIPLLEGCLDGDVADTAQCERLYKHCTESLSLYARNAGFSSVVMGLSGGIDSTLAALMCRDVFGAEHTHGVLMPSKVSSVSSVSDAEVFAKACALPVLTFPIGTLCEQFGETFSRVTEEKPLGLTEENIQARMRMIVLMALSNNYGWLPINTSNKTEKLIGYTTLYGDMAGMFSPLGCLYKREVFALTRWRNNQALAEEGVSLVPENVFIKPPSAELSANQSDEAAIGMTYGVLDALLSGVCEEGLSEEELKDRGHREAHIKRALSLLRGASFKQPLYPPAPSRSLTSPIQL